MDFIVEIDRPEFDLVILSETWRHEVEETVLTPGGNTLVLDVFARWRWAWWCWFMHFSTILLSSR